MGDHGRSVDGVVRPPDPGDFHLWFMDPADARDPELLATYAERCMTAGEGSDLAEMTEKARVQRIHAKAFTRCVLARYFGGGVGPLDLIFAHGEHGKPALVSVTGGCSGPGGGGASGGEMRRAANDTAHGAPSTPPPPPPHLRFSLSHCSELLVLAVTSAPPTTAGPCTGARGARGRAAPFAARHEIGVDAEDESRRTSKAADRLARRWLSPREAAWLAGFPEGSTRARRFMRLWTLKEAYVKALGTGIAAHPLSGFDIGLGNGGGGGGGGGVAWVREAGEDGGGSDFGGPSVEGVACASDGVDEITLTERTGAGETDGERWGASADGWTFVQLRAKRGGSLVVSVCVWDAGHRPPRVSVRWTVPLRGDVEPGKRPPPELLASSARFRERWAGGGELA